ncbi:MAG: SpoVR family protein [Planctomycetota bacterium]|jgi:stage V sporulation protein R
MVIPSELQSWKDEIRVYALEYGLDFFETYFELLDFDQLNEIASFGGFPTRYPHWRYGMQYEELMKGYSYGLSKIYELVINNDPCYAYLMRSNSLVDQKIVIAHVYGHSDFFKNNMWFAGTNRKMMDQMANHGTRVRKMIDRYGLEKVETFLDACLSLENLIDIHGTAIQRHRPTSEEELEQDEIDAPARVKKIRSKEYMDRFINPPEYLEAQKKKLAEEVEKKKRFPPEPVRDVLLFLVEHAPLQSWERSILHMVREEAYYFAPQALTKVLNEGWASYWHSKIMTSKALTDEEVVDYADHHAGTLGVRPGVINPYKLGLELLRDIEERWDKGRFGKEFEEEDDYQVRDRWDTGAAQGREKIFEVRRIYNDVTFIDTFLTEEFCEAQKLFVYRQNPRTGQMEIADRDWTKVKQELLASLTNRGQPHIEVIDGNHKNRGELFLLHRWEGVDLRLDFAQETLKNLHRIWGRPVHIETKVEGKGKLLSFDGEKTTAEDITSPEE